MASTSLLFRFLDYTVQDRVVCFRYRIEFSDRPALDFSETLEFPDSSFVIRHSSLTPFLESLHLILGISYYKTYLPPKIHHPYALSADQAEFWNTVYRKGLGEFLYRNQLDREMIAKFTPSLSPPHPLLSIRGGRGALLGIGGGKDSIVAAELLRGTADVTSLIIETGKTDGVAEEVARVIGFPILIIKRTLDPKLYGNLADSYHGHVPVSAIYAFIATLACALYGYREFIVGNESSSNIGNVEYQGEVVNHQWSKSEEFERMMREYVHAYLTPDISYRSVLRQYSELEIAKLFAQYPQYFQHFKSCNRKGVRWCGECAKCAFVFLILAPFVEHSTLVSIFGHDLLADRKLIPMYWDLLGYGTMKPFDCVGTFEEAREAMGMLGKDIRHVAIIGYGREGKVTEQYLKQYYPGLRVDVLDQSTDPDYLAKQADYDIAIKTPGIPPRLITIPYTTATNLFFGKVTNMTIGVTGSKGKSTAASLIYHILTTADKKARLLGNIGTPMLEYLLGPVDPEEILVIELSSYMLEDIEYSPHIAVLLNLFPEHMDYHGSVEKYYEAKKNIFKFQKPGDMAFKTVDEVAHYFGISDEVVAEAKKTFQPLPHRLELVGTFRGITFYDDALATAPEATLFALNKLENVATIFLGGIDRGYDFSAIEPALRQHGIKNIVLFPDSGPKMIKDRSGFTILETTSMKEAVEFAYAHTPPGSICLLSCASPSYSLWKDYEEKGNEFKRFVKELGK